MRASAAVFCLGFLLFGLGEAFALVPVPRLDGPVVDLAGVLDSGTQQDLSAQLVEFQRTGFKFCMNLNLILAVGAVFYPGADRFTGLTIISHE